MKKIFSILLYLFLCQYLVAAAIGMWTIFPQTTPVLLVELAILVPATFWLYRHGKRRGIFGKVQPSPEAKKELEEKRLYRESLKAGFADMLTKQHELESKEKQDKERNAAADFVDLVNRPGKYAAVEKYRVGYLLERGDDDPLLTYSASPEDDVNARMTPRARPIQDVVFFNENYVELEGDLLSCTESVGEYFGRIETSGYNLRPGQLVHLVLRVRGAGIDEKVTIITSRRKQSEPEANSGGYKRANLSLTAELFGFEVVIGQRLRVSGDMWKRLKPSANGAQPGYYLQTSLQNIKPVLV